MIAESDEGTDTTTSAEGVNGAGVALSAVRDSARAAFLSGEGLDIDDALAGKSEKSAPAADDDSDLDDESDEKQADDADDEADEVAAKDDSDEEDPDADLDDADEKDEKVDGDTAKRLEQVRRTDKRLREQREAQFRERERELEQKVQTAEENLKKTWEPRIEKAERVERLLSQRNFVALAQDAGFTEEDFAELARDAWSQTAEGKKDPKNAAARAHTQRERERDARVAKLEKEREEERKANAEREKKAEAQRAYADYVGGLAKAASEKTPLAQASLKDAPEFARLELETLAGQMAQRDGKLPDAKAVILAYEKQERARLRRYGFDPKTRAAIASTDSTQKTAPTKGEKKTAKTSAKPDDKKKAPRDEFIDLNGRYD